MNLKKRFMGLFLCVVLMVSMLSACTKNTKDTGETKEAETPTAAATDATTDATVTPEAAAATTELAPMEISVAVWGIQDAFDNKNASNDTIFNDLCKKFNVTIKPVGVTWNDWQEKNKVWAASGTLPDIFADSCTTDNFGLYKTWAEQGIIKELPADLSAYPNLSKLFSQNAIQALALDGKFYMIPRSGELSVAAMGVSNMSRAIKYRKDWAAAAGYTEEPTTYDQMIEMIKAMMAQHPNAVGIATNSNDFLGTFALDIFPELANKASWVYENNQWVPAYASEKTIPYMERLQKLYKDGILDPDFITQKDGDAVGKFQSGNACVILGGNFDPKIFMSSNTDVTSLSDAIGYITPFAAADGKYYAINGTPYWSETYISAQVDDAKLQRILMMMDYMYSHEYSSLVFNGIEGVDWEKTDTGMTSLVAQGITLGDKYPITGCIAWLASWRNGFNLSGDQIPNSDPVIAENDRLRDTEEISEMKICTATPINFKVLLMSNDAKNAIGGLGNDYLTAVDNFIIGSDDAKTAWDAMIKDFNSKGLQEAITSVTKQASDEGIQP